MKLFRRTDLVVRCTFRGAVVSAPNQQRLLNSCLQAQRGRLRRRLAAIAPEDQAWSVAWQKRPGDELHPRDVMAVLRLADIAVELAYAQRGRLGEVFVAEGGRARADDRLAATLKPAKDAPPPGDPARVNELLLTLLSRQRQDADHIGRLQSELAEHQRLVRQLRRELVLLRSRPGAASMDDRKFRRLKHEFSRCYHPDGGAPGDGDRERRERIFQEFWPIVEEIERSS